MSSKKVQKIVSSKIQCHFQRSTKERKTETSPWELAIVARTLALNGMQLSFLSRHICHNGSLSGQHIFGASMLMVAKPSSQDIKWNKKAVSVHKRERFNNQLVPERKFTSQKSKIYLLQIFFACQSEFWKEGTAWDFTFLWWSGTTQGYMGELTW